MIKIRIDSEEYSFDEEISILEATKSIGIYIPTLCFLNGINKNASCRVCLVENNGRLIPACDTTISEGMNILTNSSKVRNTRKTILELIAADHNFDCGKCIRNGDCELRKLCELYNIRETVFKTKARFKEKDISSAAIVRDDSKCIKCGRCISVCKEKQSIGVWCYANKAEKYSITTEYERKVNDTNCIACGQCSKVCPVGAIYEKEDLDEFWKAIDNEDAMVVVQMAPAIRVSIANELGIDSGDLSGKLVTMLKSIGVDKVFDTNFAADLTIIEETKELINRINNNGVIPLITSCSPGWVNYVEKHIPELIPNLSSCKSPQQMFGAVLKTYYAEKFNVNPKNIINVSIMPCTAKKYEANRVEFKKNGIKDVDIVLTTRELLRLIKQSGCDFNKIPAGDFDDFLGVSTGAGAIFGTTGGVMEAALRTAYEKMTLKKLEKLDFEEVRGSEGFKEATIYLDGKDIKIAVVNGIKNVKILLDKINNGEKYYFVEVMCCEGGCIGGGGQPRNVDKKIILDRMKQIYNIDNTKIIRKSHENPEIMALYKEYLANKSPGEYEELLHTNYYDRKQ